MNVSRWIALLAAFGSALAGTGVLIDSLNPKVAAIVMIISTFITIFCEKLQGGFSSTEE